jgi:predicted  nucleic acid-binding Zn-ribbon protein
MGWNLWSWIPGTKAYKARAAEEKEVLKALRDVMTEVQESQVDIRRATDDMVRSREEFREARKAADKEARGSLTGT